MDKKRMKEFLIIDANSLIHRAYHALPSFTSPDGKSVGALYGISRILIKMLKERKPDYIVAAFDRPEPTFRDELYKGYKGTRAKAEDELIYQIVEARNVFDKFGIKTFEIPGFEADDIILTLAKKFASVGVRATMYSGDFDLSQGVVDDMIVLETPKKGIGETAVYNDSLVRDRFGVNPTQVADYKGLVGDISDNIPGVPGIGPKTASELINKYGSIEDMYTEIEEMGMTNKKLFKKLKDNKEMALLSKKLAILRDDAPVDVRLEDLRVKPVDKDGLKNYFSDLGFHSLIARLN